jgi:hypothetical protein
VIAVLVSQEKTMRFFRNRVQDIGLASLHKRVLKFVEKQRCGYDPSQDELRRLSGKESLVQDTVGSSSIALTIFARHRPTS